MAIDYTKHLRSDGDLMSTAVARDLDAHVPSCPDWNVAKLTIHTGQHHRWVADAVRGRGVPPGNPPKPGLRGDELVEWFRQGWDELADLLEVTDDATRAWSWSGDNRVGFWRRRTSLETLVHRWDAENATGTPTPFDPVLSVDLVDEMFDVHGPHGGWEYTGKSARVHLATTDADGVWTLLLKDGETPVVVREREGPPDVTVEARAEDLGLFFWGRVGPDVLTTSGDEALTDHIVSWLAE